MPPKPITEIRADLKDLTAAFTHHLTESGTIKTDLAWLKKAFWVVAAASVTGTMALMVQLYLFLLRR